MPTSIDPRTVLIVEDDVRLSSTWREALEAAGMRVTCAETAGDGIALLKAQRFDVAVVDLMLRNLQGEVSNNGSLMLLAHIGLNAFEAPKVLAVSGYEETTELYQSYEILLPANTLLKPIAVDELLDRVMLLIGQRDKEDEASQMARANQRWALQRFKFATDHSQDAIYWARPNGTFFYVNDGVCNLLGHPREHLLKRRVWDVDPTMHPEAWAAHWESLRSRRFSETDTTLIDANGGSIAVHMHHHYYNFEGDEFLISTARDVTKLRQRTADLERAYKDLEEFAYAASHDLKAPLRGIDQLASWLSDDLSGQLPEASERHLDTLRQRVDRMEALLNDLLDYSRAGRVDREVRPIGLSDVIDECVQLLCVPSGFEVKRELGVDGLVGRRTPLAATLRNLIGNAIKHHDRDTGFVSVSVSPDTSDLAYLQFVVADDGPGIDPSLRERVFLMFQTLKPRDEVEGSGMGLALCKKLVEAEGGELWIDENQPRGTRFCFTWPMHA